MKARLSQREPELLERWEKDRLYSRIREKAKGREKFILHDGPPYANGNIHLGTALNKILKDIIVKARFMEGWDSTYVPGWDCHGLPIEHQVDKLLGDRKKDLPTASIRQECRAYATRFVGLQREEFKRLGVLGLWEDPYLTMNPGYVAQIVREFATLVDKGSVYRGRKPIYWCAHCRTALAEAEVEYNDHNSPSIYVRFPLVSDAPASIGDLPKEKTSVLIWTTTPWTIPANLAVALHPGYAYAAIRVPDGRCFVMAEELVETVMRDLGFASYEKLGSSTGSRWEGLRCRHPFYDRDSLIVLGDYVTLEQGTGCVHTAPGHGQEDFEAGLRYGLDVLAPVDDEGRFTKEAPPFEGQFVFDADRNVTALLREKGALLKEDRLTHSYPHCWRCKQPILYRATEQWFVSMEANGLRRTALESIMNVSWIPHWGRERIYAMIENRPDWCISRQRSWGVPIIAFHCDSCREILLDGAVIRRVADRFERDGSDCWFSDPAETFLPPDASCKKCRGNSFVKDNNILDVWFDSGVSFASVLLRRPDLAYPADMYLEGSDQHRGWFHSSLLASVGTRGTAPYRSVLTHGFVVDGKGRKMSKSLGNIIDPMELTSRYGAEIIRMWVSAEDYRDDIRISEEILARLSESYRKIRNTARFMLGNLYDFSPGRHCIPIRERSELDRWAMLRLARLIERLRQAYDRYEFHVVYHRSLEFCVVDMSSLYLDVLKEVLYVSAPDNPDRRSAQTTLYEILHALSRLLAPILSFTTEDIWQRIPEHEGKPESVHLCPMPDVDPDWEDSALEERWERVFLFRQEVSKALEIARMEKKIGHALDAWVRVAPPDAWVEFLDRFPFPLRELCIVSEVTLEDRLPGEAVFQSQEIPGLTIRVERARGDKCSRCWVYCTSVGADSSHPSVCGRCAKELRMIRGQGGGGRR
jgi:isoleucyl-tRNA synthetase